MTKYRLLLSAALPAFIAFGIAAPASAETLNVVASFTVLADVVKQVGGDHVKVSSLVGPNGDPHEFEPSPADAKKLNAAKVTFVSGEGLEGWMDRLALAAGTLKEPERALRDRVTALGRGVGAPWRAEQKAAAMAAWLVLAGGASMS